MVQVIEQDKYEKRHTNGSARKANIDKMIHSVKPLYIANNFFGIFGFRLNKGELRSPNLMMKMFGSWFILTYVVLYFYILYATTDLFDSFNMEDAVDELPVVIMIIQYICLAINLYIFEDTTTVNALTGFLEVDVELRVDKIDNFYTKAHTRTIIFLVMLLISQAINGSVDIVTNLFGFSFTSLVTFPLYFFQKLQMLIFCRFIHALKIRLQLINDYLLTFNEHQERKEVSLFTIGITTKFNVVTERKYNFIGKPSEDNKKISDLALMFDRIGKIGTMINKFYNFQIFATLLFTFIFIVIMIWSSLFYYKTPENYSGPLINIAIWCFSAIYTVVFMSFTCEQLLLVRNKTKILVNKVIMNYDLPKTMRVQAKAFMELIEVRSLRIYVYDMFSVDITLILKFISVATTYLIVIIQISHFA